MERYIMQKKRYLANGTVIYCEEELTRARAELEYQDRLNRLARNIEKINRFASDGMDLRRVSRRLVKNIYLFNSLLIFHLDRQVKGIFSPDNNLNKVELLEVVDGWGLCPVCSRKVMKITPMTRLEQAVIYCRKCKSESVVNWSFPDTEMILKNDTESKNSAIFTENSR